MPSTSAAPLASRLESCHPFPKVLRGMWVILLEIGLAIGLAVFIVWWTWPKRREPERADAERKIDEKP